MRRAFFNDNEDFDSYEDVYNEDNVDDDEEEYRKYKRLRDDEYPFNQKDFL